VRGWHKFIAEEGITADNPAAQVKPPAIAKRLPKAISISQVETLIEAANIDDSPLGLRDRALIELLYATGARISEVVSLSIDDFDRDNGVVRLFGKGSKERLAWLPWMLTWCNHALSLVSKARVHRLFS